MQFSSGYYSHHPVVDYFNSMDPESYGEKPPYGVELGVKDIGMSVPMGISAANVAGIYSKIRMGAGNIEIQFPGYIRGSRNAQTPEMLGEDQRQAIRELSLANEVKFTTHASFNLMGMMGHDQRGNFSLYNATKDMFELRRAIDFQADLGGGSVVMHSGEFDRPMTDIYIDDETTARNLARDPSGRLIFRQAHTEEIDAKFEILDDRTSAKIETVQKNRLVSAPVWLREKQGKWGEDQDGNKVYIEKDDYLDYFGRKIIDPYDPIKGRVAEFDYSNQKFNIKLQHFDYFKKEAEDYNNWYEKKHGKKPDYYEKKYPEEAYIQSTLEVREAQARGYALFYGAEVGRGVNAIKKLEELKKYYEKLDASLPEDEKWKIMMQDPEAYHASGGLLPTETKKPLDLIDQRIQDLRGRIGYGQAALSSEQDARNTSEDKSHLITPIKRLEKHGTRLYAEAAIQALRKTKDANNPVTVCIEHIFPEQFGGHIEELKWIIKKSREKFVDMLTKPEIEYGASLSPEEMTEEKLKKGVLQPNPYYMGVSEEEAQRLAERHIKATIDTGHLNLWRKYWQDDPRKNREQNDGDFRKWVLNQVESIAKEGMVGNVHLSDNYGYQDDHLGPGQGNSPIKEIISIIKKYGYDKAITVEPGADASTDLSDFHGLMKTWRFFGSPIYGMGFRSGGAPQTWSDVQYSFFGQNKPPYYLFGAYAPSNDWTLWSAVPME